MTLPAGYPIWARSSAAATYGGGANKRNYGGIGAVNANTDITAEQYLRLCADVAGIAMTSHLVMMELYNAAGTFQVNWVAPVWAPPYTTPYVGTSPPSALYPTVTATSATACQVTLPVAPADEYGVAASISVIAAIPTLLGASWSPTIYPYVFSIIDIPNAATCPVLVF
jgi:hypothetical protein